MTRSEALEVMARGICREYGDPSEYWISYADHAQAALLALEGVGMVVVKAARVPPSLDDVDGQLPISCPSRDHAPSTEKARAVDGLADPQGTGEGR
jgi:hypothetical protein